MKLAKSLFLGALVLGAFAGRAAISIPGADGSDGPLVVSTDTVIDLSQAVTAQWDANNSANSGRGVYDPAKWAVVFKYTEVTVAAGATVTFKNHISRAPVVWLISGNVTINGTVSLDGEGNASVPRLAEPGPGGFRGGAGKQGPAVWAAAGFGPGGGGIRWTSWTEMGAAGIGGVYGLGGGGGAAGGTRAPAYGNPSLVPLIGGSGGGGGDNEASDRPRGIPGGAGGGAVLIASSGKISIYGLVRANGGDGGEHPNNTYSGGAGGSGGGIRLVSQELAGDGLLQAMGGRSPWAGNGSLGRIRVERALNSSTVQPTPDPSVVTLSDGATAQLWLPENGPTVRVVSVGERPAPADPQAGFGAVGADVVLPQVTSTAVILETTNVEQASVVKVRVTPRINGDFTETDAGVDQIVSEDPLVIRWKAIVPVKDGYAAIQARVVRP